MNPTLTKSNSSYGNWAIRLSEVEIKFFWKKADAMKFLSTYTTREHAMYEQSTEQITAEKSLNKQGFSFGNWISAQDGDDSHGCMVMVKRSRTGTEYREIDPDGQIG